ncbi:MAG TPA: hypothetical protein VHX17_04490 [Candidatus Cybelea sp.]|jgi:hypothetical protein|nr:hypothetical protein [Candidatus Cybelea sp.]
MATLPLLSAYGSYAAPQPRFEAEVRRLLRRAKDPLFLATSPLAQALCNATGIPNAKQALISTIDGAFAHRAKESRLLALLRAPVTGAAEVELPDALRVTRRHLLRRRAKAVAILAAHIRQLVGPTSDAMPAPWVEKIVQPLDTIAELISLAVRERVETGTFDDKVTDLKGSINPALYSVFAAQARQIAGTGGSGSGVELAPAEPSYTAEIRFELESLALLRARHGGNVRALDAVARNLRRLAGDRAPWILRAVLAQAEASIRRGRFQEAGTLLDAVDRAGATSFAATELVCASMLRAELAFAQNDAALAERLASAAYYVLRGRHLGAYRCQTILARARLRLGARWSPPADAGTLETPAWDRVALDIETARHLAATGESARARNAAKEAFQIASERGYYTLAARAAATLGALQRGKERRGWYLRALALAMPTRDRLATLDLFALDDSLTGVLGTQPLDDLVGVLYEGLIAAVPPLGGCEAPAGREFLAWLIARSFGETRHVSASAAAVDALVANAPALARYVAYFSADVSEVLGSVMQAVAGVGERSKIQYRLDETLREVERLAGDGRCARLKMSIGRAGLDAPQQTLPAQI